MICLFSILRSRSGDFYFASYHKENLGILLTFSPWEEYLYLTWSSGFILCHNKVQTGSHSRLLDRLKRRNNVCSCQDATVLVSLMLRCVTGPICSWSYKVEGQSAMWQGYGLHKKSYPDFHLPPYSLVYGWRPSEWTCSGITQMVMIIHRSQDYSPQELFNPAC